MFCLFVLIQNPKCPPPPENFLFLIPKNDQYLKFDSSSVFDSYSELAKRIIELRLLQY